MSTTFKPSKDKTQAKIRKGRDLELQIRTTWVGGQEFVTVSDFVPTLGQDSNGVAFPAFLLGRVIEELVRIQELNGTAPRAVVGQQTLPGM